MAAVIATVRPVTLSPRCSRSSKKDLPVPADPDNKLIYIMKKQVFLSFCLLFCFCIVPAVIAAVRPVALSPRCRPFK